METVGKINNYFGKVSVAVVELSGTLKVGDRIKIKGSGTDLEQQVTSMQIDHNNIQEAKAGQLIGMKVDGKVKAGDTVYRL
ncbi:MAG: EF-Tu/IF-2/RF-3 family GTPase [Bacillota bacterium]